MDPKKDSINYLYFGTLFAILVLMASGSIFMRENLGGSQFFFFLHALGQILLEISFLIFASILINKYLGKTCFSIFIGATFLALIFHIIDFLMDRILDLSFWETFRVFVLDESLSNFLYLLDASGIPIWAWIAIALVLVSIPFLGLFLYKISDKIAQKKPLSLRHSLFLQAFFCIPFALFFWDFSASKLIHPDAYTTFIKSLPWKYTFLHPQNVTMPISGAIHQPIDEKDIVAAIDADQTQLNQRPNIYLFIIESLREDSITQEAAPNLYQFKNTYSHFDTALSNGNGSHISWFSIFHSQFPFHWSQMQKTWQSGSPSLNLLKKWGYKIRLYSSAQLGYYGMDELLFGHDQHLIDQIEYFEHLPPLSAADSDAAALKQLQQDIAENPELQQGQVFLVFWDCTHFDYTWPKNWTPKFTPFARELAYFKTFQSEKTIHQIKNRYLNAVNYMDSLFGDFFQYLPHKEEAIVVVTGDHGEEFFEHGHLFHNSHLTREQTHVPIYFKLGNKNRPLESIGLVSQMDIFPTILDAIKGGPIDFLEGNSLFQKPTWPYVITSRFNGGQTPYEFSIQNETNKLIVQFNNRSDVFKSKQLRVISMRASNDTIIPECKTCLSEWADREFGPALRRLFSR